MGGFPCQDYSVAKTLSQSEGIVGKKGVLWWSIYRILKEKGDRKPMLVFLENVDRLLKSPAKQRGRDFGVMLACFNDLGYSVVGELFYIIRMLIPMAIIFITMMPPHPRTAPRPAPASTAVIPRLSPIPAPGCPTW